ncbi:membrane protein [Salmonella enterica subsp. enterica]|uniref:Membrane protein n=1 Tax=Salmonella enterica I TaxID=59201 RepID=A0A379WPG3_SALET|nr:membrane protein [Salmonella enterica subsp. enterica]
MFFRRWPWCALPFSTMLLVARNPGWPSYQGNFFFINFLTRCDVLSGSCGGGNYIQRVFIKQQYRLGPVLKVSGIIIPHSLCNYAYTISLCGDFVYLLFFIDIMRCRMRSRGLMIPIILHILNNAWLFRLLFSATEYTPDARGALTSPGTNKRPMRSLFNASYIPRDFR